MTNAFQGLIPNKQTAQKPKEKIVFDEVEVTETIPKPEVQAIKQKDKNELFAPLKSEKEKTIAKSFTLKPSNLEKLEALVACGQYKNVSKALDGVLQAFNLEVALQQLES